MTSRSENFEYDRTLNDKIMWVRKKEKKIDSVPIAKKQYEYKYRWNYEYKVYIKWTNTHRPLTSIGITFCLG